MSKEIVLKHGNVEIVIPFNNADDLKTKLKDHEEILNVIKQNLGEYLNEKKVIRKDLEGVCDFQDEYVVLIKSPSEAVKKVALVLYAYGPQGANLNEISVSSGISNPSKKVLTAGHSARYFRKVSKKNYGLSDSGLTWVIQKVIPDLKGIEIIAKS